MRSDAYSAMELWDERRLEGVLESTFILKRR